MTSNLCYAQGCSVCHNVGGMSCISETVSPFLCHTFIWYKFFALIMSLTRLANSAGSTEGYGWEIFRKLNCWMNSPKICSPVTGRIATALGIARQGINNYRGQLN